ncbi:MAG: TetR/AcrR family transcriptional regulator [Mycolicibacterium sp.]|uniref:TetR/AcrR family transcriptional regulator n=1 Tax=Mycolicibacterium sp. TaxID=2320850 RepID=UPI003D152D2B
MSIARDQLLRAAADFLGRRPNATQDEVAAAVGVSRATLHRQFAGRPALMEALENLAIEEMRTVLKTARLHEDSAPEALQRLVSACQPVSPYLALLYSQSQEFDLDNTIQAWREIDEEITSFFQRGQSDGDFRPDLTAYWLTEAFYSLVGGMAWAIRAGRVAERDFDRLIIELLLHGARSPHGARAR